MSEPVVTEVHRPIQDMPEATVADMPLFEGAPVIPTAQDEIPTIFMPHSGQLIMVDRGVTKFGLPNNPETQAEVKVSDLSSKAGSIFHGVARAAIAELGVVQDEASIAINGLRREILERHRDRLHGRSPALYRGWARKAAEMMPELLATLMPGYGYSAQVVPEASLLVDDDAKDAATRLKELLEEEQLNGNGTPGPFEKLLMAAPSFQLQGRRSGKFTRLLSELPQDFPVSRNAIRRLTRQARTHLFIKGGNIIAPPTSRPDILEFITEDGDEEAKRASEALSNVLKKNIGFDPDRLAREEVSITTKDKESGEETELPVNALAAVHWATGLIGSGRITPCVLDIKLQTHIGKKWNMLEQIWQENSHKLAKIFSRDNLRSEDAKYSELQDHWNEMERNVAATTYSFLAFLRMSEREFRNRNPREHEPLVRWETLAKRVRAGIILVDFDISKPGEPLERSDGELPLGYLTSPPIERAGVPKDVSMMLMPVEPHRLQKRLQGREREIRRQYMRHHLSMVATQAAMAEVV